MEKRFLKYFLIFLNFAYAFVCSPFRLKISPQRRRFEISSWWLQKTVCFLLSTLTCIWLVSEMRRGLVAPTKRPTPTAVFNTVLAIFNAIAKFWLVHQFWRKQGDFESLLNFFLSEEGRMIPVHQLRFLETWLFCLVMGSYVGIGLTDTLTGRGVAFTGFVGTSQSHDISNWSTQWWWSMVLNETRFNFFLAADGTVEKSTFYQFLGVLTAVGWCHRRLVGAFSEALPMVAALTMYTVSKSFSNSLNLTPPSRVAKTAKPKASLMRHVTIVLEKGHCSPPWQVVFERYEAIKKLSDLVNSTLGVNVTIFLLVGILDYAVSFDGVFVGEVSDWSKYVGVLFYFLNCCATLILCGETCRQMGNLKKWMAKDGNRQEIPLNQLYMITNELDSNIVCIRGSDIFPVTYSMAANVIGITVTYFIICVQAR